MHGLRDAGRRSNPNTSRATPSWPQDFETVPGTSTRPHVRFVAAGAAIRGASRDVPAAGPASSPPAVEIVTRVPMGLRPSRPRRRFWALQEPEHRKALSEHCVPPSFHRADMNGGNTDCRKMNSTIFPIKPPTRHRGDPWRQIRERIIPLRIAPRPWLYRHPQHRRGHPLQMSPRRPSKASRLIAAETQSSPPPAQPDLRRAPRRDCGQQEGLKSHASKPLPADSPHEP